MITAMTDNKEQKKLHGEMYCADDEYLLKLSSSQVRSKKLTFRVLWKSETNTNLKDWQPLFAFETQTFTFFCSPIVYIDKRENESII